VPDAARERARAFREMTNWRAMPANELGESPQVRAEAQTKVAKAVTNADD
jgi:hypothetical protein